MSMNSVGVVTNLKSTVLPDEVILTWERPESSGEAVFAFRCVVQIRKDIESEPWHSASSEIDQLSLRLYNLPPATTFEWRVQMILLRGLGEKSSVQRFTTLEQVPATPPLNITVVESGIDNIRIRWEPPSIPNGVITEYIIYYDVLGEDYHSQKVVSGQETETRLDHLFPQTWYRFQIAARTRIGEGPPAPILIQQTEASPLSRFLQKTQAVESFSNPMKMTFVAGVAQHTSKGNTSYNYPPILSTGAPPRATTVQSLETKPADLCAAGAASRTDKNSRISKLCTRWLQSFDTLTETKPKETKIASIKSQTEAIVATEQPVAETKDDDQPILPLSNIDTLNYCCVTWRKKGWELFSVHIGLRAKCHYIVWIFRKMKPCRHQYRYGAEAKCLSLASIQQMLAEPEAIRTCNTWTPVNCHGHKYNISTVLQSTSLLLDTYLGVPFSQRTNRTTELSQRGISANTTREARRAAVNELARIGGVVPSDISAAMTWT
eukprot:gene189-3577_t